MPFQEELLGWNAPGIEPPQSLKDTGWEAQQKPPAPYFNWTFYLLDQALLELQQNAVHKDQGGVAGGFATLGPDGKVPGAQLNVSAPPDASTTVKGIVKLNDNTDSESVSEAATANAVRKVAEDVATHQADEANPHNVTKAQVGLSNVDNVKQMPIVGGAFTGIVTAQANTSYTVRQVRNMILSTADANALSMQNGDIWIKYK